MFSLHAAIERLRQKPEAVRTRYLFFSVGVSFLFIVALWTFSLKTSFGAIMKNDATDAVLGNIRTIEESASVSLEELMKAGENLKETAAESAPEAIQPSSQNRIENFLPNEEGEEEEQAAPQLPAPNTLAPKTQDEKQRIQPSPTEMSPP